MCKFYSIIDFFKYLPREVKWFWQRGKRGYSDRDVWNMDNWFLDIIVPMLKKLKTIKHGYPANLTPEEWDKILDRMIFCFKEANDSTCSMINEYEEKFILETFGNPPKDNKELRENYIRRTTEIEKYQLKMEEEGFQLFSKYFHNLWY